MALVPAIKPFKKYGQSGFNLSEMLPNFGALADDLCVGAQYAHRSRKSTRRALPSF